MADLDPYATIKPMLGALPPWIADPQEQRRIAAYAVYEAIYWCVPDTFKLVSRGQEDKPIYIPSGRSIVEITHRYLANEMTVAPDPTFGTPNDQLLATQVWTDFARRERVYSKFNANKRHGIMRGDWIFTLYADPLRPEGSRISFFGVDPASCFPIYNPENIDEIIGWHIAEQFVDNDGEVYIRRLTYRKTTGTGGPSPISVTDELYDIEDWGGPGMSQDSPKLIRALRPATVLPAPIDQLPLYLVPNFDTPGMIWGRSEMSGLERIMAALNQSISDEELALALGGLGVFWTDAGTPVDENGEETDWDLSPARMVELPDGKKLGRESGVEVAPSQAHLKYLHGVIDEVMGHSSVAKGNIDVSSEVAGISLIIQLGPLLARVGEKEQTVTDVMTNLLYDLAKWWVAYEGTAFNSLMEVTRWVPQYGPKVPFNTAQAITDLLSLTKEGVISYRYMRSKLRTMGFDDLPDDAAMEAEILKEKTARAAIAQDAFGARAGGELEEDEGGAEPEA